MSSQSAGGGALVEEPYDHLIKVALVGQGAVGKTTLLLRYCDDHFSAARIQTLGVDFRVHRCVIRGRRVKLQLYDTAGQERYRAVTRGFLRGMHGVLLCYDRTDRRSFQALPDWLEDVRQYTLTGPLSGPAAPAEVLLVATKLDLQAESPVERSEAAEWALGEELRLVETSAQSGAGVQECFRALLEPVVARMHDAEKRTETHASVVTLGDDRGRGKGKGKSASKCC